MDKESPPLPNRHGRSHIRRTTHVFPSGRNTLALMLTAGLFVLLSTHHPATFYHYPMPTDISPQEAKIGKAPLTSIYLSALSCFFFMQKCPFLFSHAPFSSTNLTCRTWVQTPNASETLYTGQKKPFEYAEIARFHMLLKSQAL